MNRKNTKKMTSKAAFVRSQSPTLTAPKVVEAGKKAGIKLTVGYVHNVRHAAKVKLRGGSRAKSLTRGAPPATPEALSHYSDQQRLGKVLRQCAYRIGIDNAIAMLSAERARLDREIGEDGRTDVARRATNGHAAHAS